MGRQIDCPPANRLIVDLKYRGCLSIQGLFAAIMQIEYEDRRVDAIFATASRLADIRAWGRTLFEEGKGYLPVGYLIGVEGMGESDRAGVKVPTGMRIPIFAVDGLTNDGLRENQVLCVSFDLGPEGDPRSTSCKCGEVSVVASVVAVR